MRILGILEKAREVIDGVAAICILAVVIFFTGTVFGGKQSEPKITSTVLTRQLQEVNDLAVMEYNYTRVGEFENSLTLNKWNIPLIKGSLLLTYAERLKAGMRMDQAEVDVKGKTIAVLLSEVEILGNIIDEKNIEVHDETKNIFSSISIEDYTAFATQQKDKVAGEIAENGLSSEAAIKLQSTIHKFFNMIPGVKEWYGIEVKLRS